MMLGLGRGGACIRLGEGGRTDAGLGVEDDGCGGRSAFSLGLVALRRHGTEKKMECSIKRLN